MMPSIRKVSLSSLFISRPKPQYFGNPSNPIKGSDEIKSWSDDNWLRSRFHFQFAESDDSIPSNFGVIRVLNDDLVQPKRGFGTHPHRDMEIATIILSGELAHKDSMGTNETLSRGSVQYMSAGYGINHSEFNLHPTSPLRFLQIWIVPNKKGLTPNYGSYLGDNKEAIDLRKNKWHHLVTGIKSDNISSCSSSASDTPISLHQDVNIHIAEVEQGKEVDFIVLKRRQVYYVQAEGKSILSNDKISIELNEGDAAEIYGPVHFKVKLIENEKPSIIIAIEMALSSDTRFTIDDFE